MANKEIESAIIGCGYWGSKLLDKFSSLPNTKVSGASDIKEERLREVQQKHPEVDTQLDYRVLLEDNRIKAIVVATPIASHFQLTKDALKAGKHVFCEKPLATTLKEAKELDELAKRDGLILMTDSTYLYHPAIQKIKELVKAGKLGRILFVQSLRLGLELFPKGTDVVWDLSPHDVSLTLYLMEKMPEKISLSGNSLINKGVNDTAFINLSFSENQAAQIMVGWLSPIKIRHFVVGGTEGTVLFDETRKNKLLLFDTNIEKIGNHNIFQPTGSEVAIPYPNQEPLALVCEDFISSIITKKEPLAGGEISVKTVQVLERIK